MKSTPISSWRSTPCAAAPLRGWCRNSMVCWWRTTRHALMAAAQEVAVAPTQLSFTEAIELVCVAIEDFHLVSPAQHALLHHRLLRDLAACRLPPRALRT